MTNSSRLIKALDGDLKYLSPVEWAETKRVLTKKDSRLHGKLSYSISPYLMKIANSFMPTSAAQIIAVMKGSQIGFSSAGIYTILGWIIDESPSNTLFITENDGKLKDQMQGPIDSMINSSGLADKIGRHNTKDRDAKGRRKKATGDTLSGLDFGDGFLYTLSGQVISSLSSWNIKYGIYDEVERWKGNYKKAGDFMGLVEPRHKSYADERKMLFGSTPETKHDSNIEPLYLMGDQQKYMIPCKHCGELIELIWSDKVNGNNVGIYFKRSVKGKYIEDSCTYVCQKCGKDFKEPHKFDMYDAAYYDYKQGSKVLTCDWVPTAEPESPIYESYHLSSLYSPIGFYSWGDMARKWCEIHPYNGSADVGKLQAFFNQELGLTWEERGQAPKASKLQNNVRDYEIGHVPVELSKEDNNGHILFLTCACDLNGIMGGENGDDVRLDYEITAWTERGASYSIDAGSIGTFRSKLQKVKQKKDRIKYSYRFHHDYSVWEDFAEVIKKEYSGMHILLTAVDVGNYTAFANDFIRQTLDAGYPIIGVKGDKPDSFRMSTEDKQLYRKSKEVENMYLFNVNKIKDHLAEAIDLDIQDEMQPINFMNFPNPSNGKYSHRDYFEHYEGEQKKLKKNANNIEYFLWERRHGKQNHMWDCRVYNIGLKTIIQDWICKKMEVESSWSNGAYTVVEHWGYDPLRILVYNNILGIKN